MDIKGKWEAEKDEFVANIFGSLIGTIYTPVFPLIPLDRCAVVGGPPGSYLREFPLRRLHLVFGAHRSHGNHS